MKHQLQDLIRLLPVPIAVIRLLDDKLISSNEEWKTRFGSGSTDRFSEQSLWQSSTDWATIKEALSESISGRLLHVDTALVDVKDNTRYCELSLFQNQQSDGDYVIVVAQDVTGHKENEVKIRKLAYRDLLTDLPNRAAFNDELNIAISQCLNGSESIAIGMVDLNAFKPVNDTYGHDAGDHALRVLGKRLDENAGAPHLVARIGCDEFVILFRDVESVDQIAPIMDRCVKVLSEPVCLHNNIFVTLGCSIGLVHLNASSTTIVTEAMKFADTALYEAKLARKNCWKLSAKSQSSKNVIAADEADSKHIPRKRM